MNPIVKNIIAVIAGILGGGMVNGGLIELGYKIYPVEGLDMLSHSVEYFIFPFLAHALGTMSGALVAGWMAADHKMRYALIVGAVFLMAGIAACFIISAPLWFIVTDLLLAYIPMAWIGGSIAQRFAKK